MEEYKNQTEPVVHYYEEQGIVKNIDASQSTEKVFADIQTVLDDIKQRKING